MAQGLTSSQQSGRRWARWTEPWYVAYGLAGLVLLGVGPILIPLALDPKGPTAVAAVVSAFYVGALFTPLIGSWADRTGLQRASFLACFPLMAVTLIAFAYADAVWERALLAAVFGGGGAVAGTIGGMFIVEAHPKAEWNPRIAWFRVAYGLGQVVGLVVAAATVKHLRVGWWIAGLAILSGVGIGRIGAPRLSAVRPAPKSLPRATTHDARVVLEPETSWRPLGAISWVLHTFHRPRLPDLRKIGGRFTIFIVAWLVTMIGVQTFFNVVPLIMRDAFGVHPSVSSILFMIGAALGVGVFPLCGTLANRIGPSRVLGIGILITIAAFAAMSLVSWLGGGFRAPIASVALVVAAVAYSFEVVGATMVTVRLAPGSEGSAMGLMNGAIAAGAIEGALVPSFVARKFGYDALPPLAMATLVVALVVGLPVFRLGLKSGVSRSARASALSRAST